MTNGSLVEAVRAASPEEQRSVLVELVKLTLGGSRTPVRVADADGQPLAAIVPNNPPPLTSEILAEIRRRLSAPDEWIDAEEAIAEHRRRAASRSA